MLCFTEADVWWPGIHNKMLLSVYAHIFALCINSITAIFEPRRSLARGWPKDPASMRRLSGADFRHQVYRLQCTPGSSCQRRFTTYRIGFVLLWWPSHTQVLFSGGLDSHIMLYWGGSVALCHDEQRRWSPSANKYYTNKVRSSRSEGCDMFAVLGSIGPWPNVDLK